jgi:hypothetical protein
MAFSNRPTTLRATRARGGRLGRPVLWVLLISTVLAALGLFAAWTWRSGDLASSERSNGKQPADAQAFHTPAPQPVIPQPAQTAAPGPSSTAR